MLEQSTANRRSDRVRNPVGLSVWTIEAADDRLKNDSTIRPAGRRSGKPVSAVMPMVFSVQLDCGL